MNFVIAMLLLTIIALFAYILIRSLDIYRVGTVVSKNREIDYIDELPIANCYFIVSVKGRKKKYTIRVASDVFTSFEEGELMTIKI